nr:Ig-like domain-containing protein [Prolixibacteraceae bacterium]
FSTEDDTIFSAVVSDELLSDQVNVIAFTDSSFFDTAVCGRNVVDIATTLEFDVADIDNPEATYYPNGEYDNSDYTGVDLTMMFNDNVTAAEAEAGKNIYIFDADTDLPVDTIASYEFTSEDNSSYQALVDLYFGSFYVLADTASFFDAEAVAFAQNYNGISSDTVWAFDVVDSSFGTCVEGQSPAVNATGVETTTQISITFCDEINIGPAGRTDRFVSVANADEQFTYVVVDSMIEGNTLTIDVEDLSENTQYSVYIQEGAITDEYGNEWDVNTDAFWWPFTTGDFTKPEVTLEAGEAAEGTDVQATMTTTENGTLYLIEEGVAIDDVDVMDGAIDADKAVKVSAAADVPANVNVNGLVPGTYNAVAVDASGNISEKSINTFVIVSYPEVTIADIQGEGDVSPYADQIVVTSGTVTGIDEDGSGFFMQDANEARGGIYVYDSELAANVGVGTSVKITATAEEFYTLTQLSDVIAYEFTAKVVETEVIEITAAEVGEDYEGVLVKVDSLKTTGLPNDESYGEWYTADTENDVDVTIDEQLFTFVPDAGQRYDITGVCNYTYDEYKLAPRSIADIEIVTGIKMLDINIDIYPNPFDTYVKFDVSRDVEITKAVITNIAGQLVKQVDYPANTIQTNELRSGVYFISLQTEQGIAKTARIIKR